MPLGWPGENVNEEVGFEESWEGLGRRGTFENQHYTGKSTEPRRHQCPLGLVGRCDAPVDLLLDLLCPFNVGDTTDITNRAEVLFSPANETLTYGAPGLKI